MRAYFDHNATTPLDPRVLEAMLPWLAQRHGNPSSAHVYGREASAAVEQAREQVAYLIGAAPRDVVFTASGSEANNAVIASYADVDVRLAVSSFEHPSVLRSVEVLEKQGAEVAWVDPEATGRCSVESWAAVLDDRTSLAVLMLANNEVGTLQPLAEVAARAADLGVPVLTDAVQAVGKVEVSVEELGVDYLVLGGHKFHGPLGAAAVWIKPGARWKPFIRGGSQEHGRRASTVNVPAVVGLGRVAEIAHEELDERHRRLAALRDRFEAGLEAIPDVAVHCAESPRLPNTSHIAPAGVEGEALMIRLDLAGFAVSTGSACASGVVEPSPTLLALGLPEEEALASLRVSFGLTNTGAEVDALLEALSREIAELRALTSTSAP